jgi:hypothetical protein
LPLNNDEPQADTAFMREAGKKQLIIGLVIAAVGVAISLGSYVSAASSSGGGSYFLLWGIVIVGLVRAFRGFSMMRSAGPAQVAPAETAEVTSPAGVPAMPPQPPAETTPALAVEATTPEPASPASPPPPPSPSSMWD